MLERIKALEAAGAWGEIRQHAPALLAGLTGDDLTRGYLGTSKAFEETAACSDDYRTALAHTRAGLDAATTGGLMHTWLLHRLCAFLSDLGDFAGAERAGAAFLVALPSNPAAEQVAPWVYFHLGRVEHYLHRNTGKAAARFRQAADADAGAISERARLFLVWTLAEAGRTGAAVEAMPSHLSHLPAGHVAAAQAVVCASAGDWPGARHHAHAALRSLVANGWQVYDTVQAAELCLILKRAAVEAGDHQQAAVWFVRSAALLARWNVAFATLLVPTLRARGGEYVDAATAHRGPAGHKRAGLRGALG